MPHITANRFAAAAPARLVVLVLLALALVAPALAQPPAVVYVLPIDGMIDLGLAPFVERGLKDAAAAGAAAVILEINTFGGRVDAAVQIRDALLRSPLRTVAFVNQRAISAGALISLSATTIAMAQGATIGAATPVQAGGTGAATKGSEKTVSYVRKEFRATAESRGRPPLVAEAMVDEDVVIAGVIEKGKLLTLTTAEALKLKVADMQADTLEALLAKLGLANAEVRRVTENWAESIVRFLTHPILSSLLVTIGMLGIIVELRTPGFGFPGALGIASLAAFFWGHTLVRLVGWEEMMLIAVGLTLLTLEIFVIPGFGIAGVLGIVALIAGLSLSMVGAGATINFVLNAVMRVLLSLLLALAASLVLLRWLPRLPFGNRLVLQSSLGSEVPAAAPADDRRWTGRRGTAASTLRPAGIADIDGERVDVVSEGEFIETGEPIEVIRVEGNRVVVRRARDHREGRS